MMMDRDKMTQMMSDMCEMADSEDVKPMDPALMQEMIPACMNMMLLTTPKESQPDFILNMIESLFEQGTAKMNDKEKSELKYKIIEKVSA